MRRIRRLLNRPEPRHTAFTPAVAAGIIILIAAAALTAWQPRPQDPPHPAAAEGPYRKWLTEDVAYIITNEERTAFKNLQTDEEREHFIEQFWLRRDPTPGTVENEFKQEHYRRIAYANQHFTQPDGLAGWKTDRGRIYITFGPPDEIEDHPSGGGAHPFPYVQWMYHLLPGIGNNVIVEFDDPNRTGEYHMTADSSVPRASLFTDTVKRGPLHRQVRLIGSVLPNGTVALLAPDAMMKDVAIGQAVTIKTGSGRVSHIEPAVTGSSVAIVALDAPMPASEAGKNVEATIDIETIADTVYIGRPVVASANSDGTIFKIEPDGKHAVRVPVHFGRASVNQIEIVSGLVPGDRVILSDMSAYANYDRIEMK
jgi:GWxTD domain-containing protein